MTNSIVISRHKYWPVIQCLQFRLKVDLNENTEYGMLSISRTIKRVDQQLVVVFPIISILNVILSHC